MDAPTFNGSDDRDELTHDPADDACPDCGADADSPCEADCGCLYCRKRELLALDVVAGEGE